MGSWGAGIFSNDDACDIRDNYLENLLFLNDDEAERAALEEYGADISDNMWVALAVTEWKYGRLSEKVKSAALSAIARELLVTNEVWKKSFAEKRKAALRKASAQLETEMPPRKKVSMPSWSWKCPWNVGDVLQYKLWAYPHEELNGKYVLLPIVAVYQIPEVKVPLELIIVGLCDWLGDGPPDAGTVSRCGFSRYGFPSGLDAETLVISPSKEIIKIADIKQVGHIPVEELQSHYGMIEEVFSSSDALLEPGIYLTFSNKMPFPTK